MVQETTARFNVRSDAREPDKPDTVGRRLAGRGRPTRSDRRKVEYYATRGGRPDGVGDQLIGTYTGDVRIRMERYMCGRFDSYPLFNTGRVSPVLSRGTIGIGSSDVLG